MVTVNIRRYTILRYNQTILTRFFFSYSSKLSRLKSLSVIYVLEENVFIKAVRSGLNKIYPTEHSRKQKKNGHERIYLVDVIDVSCAIRCFWSG